MGIGHRYHHVQPQTICNMIISLIQIALIEILCTNIFESCVTYIHVPSYTCIFILIPILSQPHCIHSKRSAIMGDYTLCKITELPF